ncbi:putative bifunctional diguanylate cyclase/phosphodiesterase [Halomonas sp. HL-93]|uniref:putative bifunctional diguanylate cyclase/phosphodiesterase n=1 Tax=Halomonas sp. HL-93 TaxID=1666906 RepID=UPI0006DA0645|nr:GGDEF domain-containing phosphodiesterase [Halomonas sp. HL-93]KPQ21932.1 MAG: EAL domain [Halomonas sp. HL-93]SBR46234.1 diguanylate cyclase (GGDEF) domain-containing protein [Halomonas sp. HL-93]
MKPTQSLLMVFLLPVLMIIVPALILGAFALTIAREKALDSYRIQSADLATLVEMANFERRLGNLHESLTQALNESKNNHPSKLDRYSEYSYIDLQLDEMGERIEHLAGSGLIDDLHADNAETLLLSFQEYRRFIDMANEAATLNQNNVGDFMQEAEANFNRFIIFTQRTFEALTERANERHQQTFQALSRSIGTLVWFGLGLVCVLIGGAAFASWRINRRLMIIGDAILDLSTSHQTIPDFDDIQRISQRHSGPLKHIATALLSFRKTEQKRREAERKVHRLAYYDTLTQLPNWRLMKEHLQLSIDTNQQTDTFGALVYLDIDNFKRINDSCGHRAGDCLLQELSERLSALNIDGATLGRVGGDEFVMIVDGLPADLLKAAEKTERLTEQLQHSLGQPYQWGQKEHYLSASIGIALFGDSEHNVDNLFQYASAAANLAKQSAPNGLRFYDPAVQAELEAKTELERDLRLAIERQEFVLVYQTQVDSKGRAIGAEALIRWQHPQQGFISPGTFIPLAEETGLIVPIGQWVLEAACAQLVAWANDTSTDHLVLAVNVSAKQFQQPDFVDTVRGALANSGASAQRLKLELTESTVIGSVDDTIARMHQLKALGISFAMDDFGTGYSSLQYLKRLPLDQIKIDQSFVRDLHQNPDDMAIVQTIIAMGRALGLNVIAEGVETLEHWRYLNDHQCHAYQGYYFCKPLSAVEMVKRSLTPPPMLT